MAWTPRQRELLDRTVGYALNPLHVRYRMWRGKDQRHDIGGVKLTLPPDHNLPFYQRRDPTYDTYAIELLRALASGRRHVTVVDLGANVGDTAAAVLASHPETDVVCVEGGGNFLTYLRRNMAPYSDRARVVEGFVGPLGENLVFRQRGSTGGFFPGARSAEPRRWVSPEELLAPIDGDDLVVWKSDIDAFDIHVLVDHWDVIAPRCDVVWFEFDSPRTAGDRSDIDELIARLAESDRTVLVYDNLGRLMVHFQPDGIDGLFTLSQWLHQQYSGHVAVPYLDIWAITPEAFSLMDG